MTKPKRKKIPLHVEDAKALRYEEIHRILAEHPTDTQAMLVELARSEKLKALGMNWQRLQEVIESEDYRVWRRQKLRLLKDTGEMRAFKLLASVTDTGEATRIAMFLAQGKADLEKVARRDWEEGDEPDAGEDDEPLSGSAALLLPAGGAA